MGAANEGQTGLEASALWPRVQQWATELGFSQIGVADIDLGSAEPGLQDWLAAGFNGSMHYMSRHGMTRARPAELVNGTLRVLTARMDYLPRPHGPQTGVADGDWQAIEWQRLRSPERATVSIYARGRDYHKVLRQRLQTLADRIAQAVGPFGHRVFTDSAPVLEVELATRSGIGWRGKHTLTLHREAGSMFFLGEIYLDLPLPLTEGLDAQQMRVRMGAFALATDTVPESVRRAVIEARLSSHDWTDRELIVTAVHAHSGEFVTFDRHGAVGLVDAVTASCAVPGVWPPVSIDGARYIDGGVRSGVNLDLAAGADVVVVLAPSAMGFGGSVHDEAEPLRSAGAVVEVIVADEGSLAAFGTNVLDPATRAPSLAEGRRQGAEAAERLRAVWR